MPVCRIIMLLHVGIMDDLMHYCTQSLISSNSASGRPWDLGAIVFTILKKALNNCILSHNCKKALLKVHADVSNSTKRK